jgi:hypothetical protein
MAAKLTRLTHKIAIQLHLVAESCTICSSLQAASPETFGYTLVHCVIQITSVLLRTVLVLHIQRDGYIKSTCACLTITFELRSCFILIELSVVGLPYNVVTMPWFSTVPVSTVTWKPDSFWVHQVQRRSGFLYGDETSE